MAEYTTISVRVETKAELDADRGEQKWDPYIRDLLAAADDTDDHDALVDDVAVAVERRVERLLDDRGRS
jgi:hypothetical protein